jgi:hypothetical protein
MNALTFTITDDQIAITHAGQTKTFTAARLREIATTLLTYYQEGSTDLVLSLGYSLDASVYGIHAPADFDSDCNEYWSHRRELYQFVADQALFPITLETHTAEGVDVASVTSQWRSTIGQETAVAAFNAWKAGDEVLAGADLSNQDDRTAVIQAYRGACVQTPLCETIRTIALEQYGIADGIEQHKLCSLYSVCHETGGANYLIGQLTDKMYRGDFTLEELETLRTQIADAIAARNTLLSRLLETES